MHVRDGSATIQSNLLLDECLEYCRNKVGCVALDYVVSTNQCWWHHSQTVLNNAEPQIGTDLYIRTDDCGKSRGLLATNQIFVIGGGIYDQMRLFIKQNVSKTKNLFCTRLKKVLL